MIYETTLNFCYAILECEYEEEKNIIEQLLIERVIEILTMPSFLFSFSCIYLNEV